jgi:opacity protein-like surface antigen
MRHNFVLLVGAVALIASATNARAGAYGETEQVEEKPAAAPAAAMQYEEEAPDYAAVGPYLGIGGNYAIQNFQDHGPGNVGNSAGFHVRGGYRVHPYVAVEALYEYFSEFDNDGRAKFSNLDQTDHYDGWAVTANVKGYMLTGRWQPYALLGLGYVDINGHNVVDKSGPGNGFEMRFGLGMDACITEHVAIGPEVAYVLPFDDANNMDLITVALGLRYKF